MALKKYEINCDMGEGFGRWKMVCLLPSRGLSCLSPFFLQGPDEELMKVVDVANIACGFHAGDPSIMRNVVRMTKEHGVKAGAHPGLQGTAQP